MSLKLLAAPLLISATAIIGGQTIGTINAISPGAFTAIGTGLLMGLAATAAVACASVVLIRIFR